MFQINIDSVFVVDYEISNFLKKKINYEFSMT